MTDPSSDKGPFKKALGVQRTQLLNKLGVEVSSDGIVARGDDTVRAWEALSAGHSYADTLHQTENQLRLAVSLGVTTMFDMGGTIPAGGWLEPGTGYNPVLELMRKGRVPSRLRLFLPVLDTDSNQFARTGGDYGRSQSDEDKIAVLCRVRWGKTSILRYPGRA